MESEYGSGVVVCLAKFSEHMSLLVRERWKDSWMGGTESERLSEQISMWMNGASDHFFDLDYEKAPEPLRVLASLTLRIGYGFTGETWTMETIKQIEELWRESCLAVDAMLGVEADWGTW